MVRKDKKRPSVAGKRVATGHKPYAAPSAPDPARIPDPQAPATPSQGDGAARPSHGGVPTPQAPTAKTPEGGVSAAPRDAGRTKRAARSHGPFSSSRAQADESPTPANASRISGSSSGSSATPRLDRSAAKPVRRARLSRKFVIGAAVIIVVLAVATGLLSWNQWFRYDDAADIQGSWAVEGTSEIITFTDTDIVMTPEVSYPYTLDTFNKTIDFSFKQYGGEGKYVFSPERTTLVITETDADTQEDVSTTLVKQ